MRTPLAWMILLNDHPCLARAKPARNRDLAWVNLSKHKWITFR